MPRKKSEDTGFGANPSNYGRHEAQYQICIAFESNKGQENP